ncbi:hypothetical protein BH09PAT2_BH09PAT2_08510 [soil metagenome]
MDTIENIDYHKIVDILDDSILELKRCRQKECSFSPELLNQLNVILNFINTTEDYTNTIAFADNRISIDKAKATQFSNQLKQIINLPKEKLEESLQLVEKLRKQNLSQQEIVSLQTVLADLALPFWVINLK